MEKKDKGSKGLVIVLVIFIIISLGLGCYIGYDKFINDSKCTTEEKTNNEEKENKEDSKKTTTEEVKSSKAKCYGTYYVNGIQSEGTYVLNEDGTWKVENSEQNGVFIINENTITMIEKKHTVGPKEEDPYYYNPKSYLISDDCSNIRLTESGSHTAAYLQKSN